MGFQGKLAFAFQIIFNLELFSEGAGSCARYQVIVSFKDLSCATLHIRSPIRLILDKGQAFQHILHRDGLLEDPDVYQPDAIVCSEDLPAMAIRFLLGSTQLKGFRGQLGTGDKAFDRIAFINHNQVASFDVLAVRGAFA